MRGQILIKNLESAVVISGKRLPSPHCLFFMRKIYIMFSFLLPATGNKAAYVLALLMGAWGLSGEDCPQQLDFVDDDCINIHDVIWVLDNFDN